MVMIRLKYLVYVVLLLGLITDAAIVAQDNSSVRYVSQSVCTSVSYISALLQLREQDVIMVVGGDSAVVQALKQTTSVQHVVSAPAEDIIRIRPTAIIVIADENMSAVEANALLQQISEAADGTRIVSSYKFEEDAMLHLDKLHVLPATATIQIPWYLYHIQRPTTEQLIEEIYRTMSGFKIDESEAEDIAKVGGDPTYGEITFPALYTLFTQLVPISGDDVVYDLGSGIGKLIMWVYLATPARKAVGVELSHTRYAYAKMAEATLRTKIMPLRRDLRERTQGKVFAFRKENMLATSMADATVVFICATCFSDELMQKLADKLSQLSDGARIITLKQFPEHPALHFRAMHRLMMTWSRPEGSPVYIYEKRVVPATPVLMDKESEEREFVSQEALPLWCMAGAEVVQLVFSSWQLCFDVSMAVLSCPEESHAMRWCDIWATSTDLSLSLGGALYAFEYINVAARQWRCMLYITPALIEMIEHSIP